MATYGQGIGGGVPWTGYSNTLGDGPANTDALGGHVAFNGITQGDDRLAKMFRNGGKSLVLRRLMFALLGQNVGAAAVETKKQVQGTVGGFGGVVPIETVTLVNRATSVADVNAAQALLYRSVFPASYPADVSGNGGGGKQQISGAGAY